MLVVLSPKTGLIINHLILIITLMKNNTTRILIIFLSLSFINSYGQSKKPIPEPEFINQIYFFEKQTGILTKLEQNNAKVKTKVKGLGYGGYEMQYQINNTASPIRIPQESSYSFVVSFGESMGDPSSLFALNKAEIKKNIRYGTHLQASMIGKVKENENVIPYDVKKVKDKVFEIIPSVKLNPGEYFFVNKGSAGKYNGIAMDVFCFGVD